MQFTYSQTTTATVLSRQTDRQTDRQADNAMTGSLQRTGLGTGQ